MNAGTEQQLQAAEYSFPYHHLPHRDLAGLRVGRIFRGGAEYLAYVETSASLAVSSSTTSVLDVGCGDGRLLALIAAEHPTVDLTGIDLDERAIGLARAFVPDVTFEVKRVEDLDAVFDSVTCIETIEHIPDETELPFIASVGDRVRPGGTLVITVPSTARSVTEKHFRHYDPDLLRGRLSDALPEFEVTELREIVQDRPWLDRFLKLMSNRFYSVDVGALNEFIARLHRQNVRPDRRGLHVLAVLRRTPGD